MVRVGLGIIIVNDRGEVLIGRRINIHAPYYAIPGGHLEVGETFEAGAIREIEEGTGLMIKDPRVIAITNNLETFKESGKHHISVGLLATEFDGELRNMEPEKCEGWLWVNPRELPKPLFDASQKCIECYLEGKFYN